MSASKLSPGTRLRSDISAVEIIVVKAPRSEVELCCGGHPLVIAGGTATTPVCDPQELQGTLRVGKRYTLIDQNLEVLCTKAGAGTLTLDGAELVEMGAKPLPASD